MHVDTSTGQSAATTSTAGSGDSSSAATSGTTAQAAASTAPNTTPTGEASTATATTGTTTAEAYQAFSVPDGVTLDQAAVDRFTPKFRELGLSQDQAQGLVDAFAEHQAALVAGSAEQAEQWYADRRAREIAEANDAGLTAIKADPELGGPKFEAMHARVTAAIGAVATPEIRAEMDKHGWGNNPELVRLVSRLIGYREPDPGTRPAGGGGTGASDPATILYG